ncbi:sucrase ferredoxin [Chromohalobacter nigrandesensis]|uniref:sucrase ferredoxin n=1 Tax=Chromohalobacter nigrandesensis TaxID=119863 RepID=UPI001FF11E31|nr:sucrase ferredoxin [Chromohalobacter nigrandesensis]MCK0744303.1 sucrase ferredoxin [Chromohalobacter nigrandesensis]
MSHRFCADLSRERHDPLAGSAAHVERNLLISWPRAKWTRNLRHAHDMPDSLVQTLDAIAADGRRVNLIHRREQASDSHQVFLMPERRRFVVPREALEAFLTAWQSGAPLTAWEGEAVDRDLLLCCTHGKKDKCCAKYGHRTYKQLAQVVAAYELPFDVWESSHLGGCRLAASIILLSPVRKYGRITPQQALPFLHAEAQGRRFLPGYRGDSRLTPAQQCAQLAVLSFLEQRYPTANLTLQDDTGNEHRRHILWRWEQDGEHGRLQVICETTTVLRVDTCSDLDDGPTESLVWNTTDISAA